VTAVPFNTLTQTRHGAFVVHRHDMYVAKSLTLYGEFSPGELALYKRYIRAGMLVVDAGANLGALTVPIARIVGDTGAVIAVEPQRLTYQALCGNLALNSIKNTLAFHCALGAEEGTITVPNLDVDAVNNFGALTLDAEYERGAIVPLTTLDNLLGEACHFVKIDVEGMEREVLAGACQTIAKHRPVLYVENDREQHSAGLIDDLRQFGYRMWWHRPPLFESENFKRNAENVFTINGQQIVSINMLCLPTERTDIPTDLVEVE
jgi:FkbM family methyltransferase